MKVSKYRFTVDDLQEIDVDRLVRENPLDDVLIIIVNNCAMIFAKEWILDILVELPGENFFLDTPCHTWNGSFFGGRSIERSQIDQYVKTISEHMRSMKKRQPVHTKAKKEKVDVLVFDAEQH